MGDVVVKLPLPPGTFPTLWGADQRYKETYMSNYPGYYQTYDAVSYTHLTLPTKA